MLINGNISLVVCPESERIRFWTLTGMCTLLNISDASECVRSHVPLTWQVNNMKKLSRE